MDFAYTDTRRVLDSVAVSNLYYNSNTKQLGVTFKSGGTYVYDGVPRQTFLALSLANSKGEAMPTIKKNYKALGEASEVYKVGSRPAARPGPASWERPRDAFGRFLAKHHDTTPSVSAAPVATPVAVPTGVPAAAPVRVALGVSSENAASNVASTFRLATEAVPTGVKRRYEVHFATNGLDNVYKIEAGSETEAVQALKDAADALGVEATVRKVVAYY